MVVVRPSTPADVAELVDLASLAGAGLTTLPRDAELLSKRVAKSVRSFASLAHTTVPAGESYLLVMQDAATSRVVGACGIVSKVGGFQPFYSYRLERQLFESPAIGVRREVPLLRLHEEHDGPCEIGSLFLHPDFRRDGNGRFLQLVRFLLMAEHPTAFEPVVVSEIRGVSDDDGRSPFWDAVGGHFFGIDFRAADHLSVVNKRFIADLMPDHPLYIPLLPAEAQAVIGQPHPQSRQAVRNLESEGFRFANEVDIFDAGPVYRADRDSIRTIAASAKAAVTAVSESLDAPAADFMIGTTTDDFRAVRGPLIRTPRGVALTTESARLLRLRAGDPVRFVELSPPAATPAQ